MTNEEREWHEELPKQLRTELHQNQPNDEAIKNILDQFFQITITTEKLAEVVQMLLPLAHKISNYSVDIRTLFQSLIRYQTFRGKTKAYQN